MVTSLLGLLGPQGVVFVLYCNLSDSLAYSMHSSRNESPSVIRFQHGVNCFFASSSPWSLWASVRRFSLSGGGGRQVENAVSIDIAKAGVFPRRQLGVRHRKMKLSAFWRHSGRPASKRLYSAAGPSFFAGQNAVISSFAA
jgi:hypothetical protein